eukprot:TRINITY_DN1126_c0_g1_i1.p1 TRINITY_DN1126_c0_g1~~TRINITY_DN1126_c0_g1_i1.p1  ORF type:complete len:186 (-),score=49.68 TRINITY_DN1126_c0_g1_i1:202-759(-)
MYQLPQQQGQNFGQYQVGMSPNTASQLFMSVSQGRVSPSRGSMPVFSPGKLAQMHGLFNFAAAQQPPLTANGTRSQAFFNAQPPPFQGAPTAPTASQRGPAPPARRPSSGPSGDPSQSFFMLNNSNPFARENAQIKQEIQKMEAAIDTLLMKMAELRAKKMKQMAAEQQKGGNPTGDANNVPPRH